MGLFLFLTVFDEVVYEVEGKAKDEDEEQGGEEIEIEAEVEDACFIVGIGTEFPPMVGGGRVPGEAGARVEMQQAPACHSGGVASVAGGDVVFIGQGAFSYAVVVPSEFIRGEGAVECGIGVLE